MRIRVLPRAIATAVLTSGLATAGRLAGVATLLLTIPMLVETLAMRGRAGDLALPLLLVGLLLGGLVGVILRPRLWTVAAFLGAGGAIAVLYEVVLLVGDPALLDEGLFLVNRPTVALAVAGGVAVTVWGGMVWAAVSCAVAVAASGVAALLAEVPFRPGLAPFLALGIAVVAHAALAAAQAGVRRRVPDFDSLEAEMRLVAHDEDLARRSTAIVHDTVLNDLAFVMNAPDRIDDRARDRLRADLATLRSPDWIAGSDEPFTDTEAGLRNDIDRLVSEYQWQGLSIHVTGSLGRRRLAPDAAAALLATIRAAFDNVARHAGAPAVELELLAGDTDLTVMVTDHGQGFDPAAVQPDRLGVRTSILARMSAVGGTARVWSTPGEGTSVLLTVPFREDAR